MDRRKALENIFSKILGSNVKLEQTNEVETLKFKKQFVDTIELFEKVWHRQENLLENFDTNLSSYDDMFFQVIERFIHLCFDPIFSEAILFYIYQRYQGEEIIPFKDEEGNDHYFNTVDDLWEFFDKYDYDEDGND